jgi:aminoglycoside phosphotransferase (APT) family kinase protein
MSDSFGRTLSLFQVQLDRWARNHYHDAVTVVGLRPMPGHAGLSFGFRVVADSGQLDHLVIRMPPKGVRRRGNTDVLRQVPLLHALAREGLPVAEIVWWDADEQWFEVPFFMVRFLHGSTYAVREPDPAFDGVTPDEVFRSAVDALASVHRVDHRRVLGDWEPEKDLRSEIEFWSPILHKAADPAWIAMGERTRDLLLASVPEGPQVGIFHGDFQTNNVLFERAEVVALIDWEISGIGAQLIDLGWLLFMNDAESWADPRGLEGVPPFERIVGWYAAASGRSVRLDDVAFYRALSGYRFGVISCLNVMLHRTGKRHDPEWERIALSIPLMFERAATLVR